MFLRYLALSAVVIALLMPVGSARAQGAGIVVAPTIMVLDINRLQRDAAAVKSVRDQVNKFKLDLQNDAQKQQESFRTSQQDLVKKQTLLAPEAFADERRKFEQRFTDVQGALQERRRSIAENEQNAMLEVQKVLTEVVANMASKNGYAMVIRRSQVVIADTALDITDAVLTELDKKLPTVAVAPPTK